VLKLEKRKETNTMKKVLLTILGIIVVLGVLAGAGFTGYRIGYQQGALSVSDGNTIPFMHGLQFGSKNMPMHNFGRDFEFRSQPFHSPMMRGGGGFNFDMFGVFHFLWNAVVLGLVIWFVYWLFTKSGWRLTRTHQSTEDPSAGPGKAG
jgi:hypothetical protein